MLHCWSISSTHSISGVCVQLIHPTNTFIDHTAGCGQNKIGHAHTVIVVCSWVILRVLGDICADSGTLLKTCSVACEILKKLSLHHIICASAYLIVYQLQGLLDSLNFLLV